MGKKKITVEEFQEGGGGQIILLLYTNTYISQCVSLAKKYFSNFLHGVHRSIDLSTIYFPEVLPHTI